MKEDRLVPAGGKDQEKMLHWQGDSVRDEAAGVQPCCPSPAPAPLRSSPATGDGPQPRGCTPNLTPPRSGGTRAGGFSAQRPEGRRRGQCCISQTAEQKNKPRQRARSPLRRGQAAACGGTAGSAAARTAGAAPTRSPPAAAAAPGPAPRLAPGRPGFAMPSGKAPGSAPSPVAPAPPAPAARPRPPAAADNAGPGRGGPGREACGCGSSLPTT